MGKDQVKSRQLTRREVLGLSFVGAGVLGLGVLGVRNLVSWLMEKIDPLNYGIQPIFKTYIFSDEK